MNARITVQTLILVSFNAVFFIATAGAETSCQRKYSCGVANEHVSRRRHTDASGRQSLGTSSKIINGKVAGKNQFPWLTLVIGLSKKSSLLCGGSLVTDRHVVTAAHCYARGLRYTVILGVHRRSGDKHKRVRRPAERFVRHPRYDRSKLVYDVAVITFAPVRFSPIVRTICLPRQGFMPNLSPATVAGWGVTSYGADKQSRSDVLRMTSVTVWSSRYCYQNSAFHWVTPTQLCGAGEDTDACSGDSGGPLMYRQKNRRFILLGIVSWGVGCNNKKYPGRYTWVGHPEILQWTNDNIRGGLICRA